MFDYLSLFVTCASCNNDFLVSNLGSDTLCGSCDAFDEAYEALMSEYFGL